MSRYAEGTSVSVDRSRAEVEAVLHRFGANKFMYYREEDTVILAFVLVGPAGNRFGRCRDCAERDLAEYSRTESGWSIDEATEAERTTEMAG